MLCYPLPSIEPQTTVILVKKESLLKETSIGSVASILPLLVQYAWIFSNISKTLRQIDRIDPFVLFPETQVSFQIYQRRSKGSFRSIFLVTNILREDGHGLHEFKQIYRHPQSDNQAGYREDWGYCACCTRRRLAQPLAERSSYEQTSRAVTYSLTVVRKQ